MKVLVYSANYGGYDDVIPDADRRADWHYRRDTVNETHPGDHRLAARLQKIYPADELWDDYDASIWIDSKASICGDITVDDFPVEDIACLPHPTRNTVKAECDQVYITGKANPVEQWAAYQRDGFPDDLGLWETTVMFRRHTPAVRAFCIGWWDHVRTYTVRDQISLPYIAWCCQHQPVGRLTWKRDKKISIHNHARHA